MSNWTLHLWLLALYWGLLKSLAGLLRLVLTEHVYTNGNLWSADECINGSEQNLMAWDFHLNKSKTCSVFLYNILPYLVFNYAMVNGTTRYMMCIYYKSLQNCIIWNSRLSGAVALYFTPNFVSEKYINCWYPSPHKVYDRNLKVYIIYIL